MRGLDGREYGPVDLEKLLQWAREGRLVASMMVQVEGSGVWVSAGSLPELAAIFGGGAPQAGIGGTNYGPGTPFTTNATPGAPEVNSNPNLGVGYIYGKAWDLLTLEFVLQVLVFMIISAVSSFLAILIAGPLLVGLMRCALKRLDGEPAEFGLLFSGFNQFVECLVASLLMMVAGFAWLCPPFGLFVSVKLYHWSCVLADRPGRGGFEALQDSWAITNGRFFDLLLLGIVSIGVSLIGLALCVVGIIPAVALTVLAVAAAFREMVPRKSPQSTAKAFA